MAATFTEAQTLPRVGQVLWEIRYDGFVSMGGISYAESAGLLFAGASGRVLVVRGATGEVLDTIYTSTEEWRIRPDVPPMRDVVDISCSRDGKVLCLTAIIGSNYKTVIMDYPSKRIIKDSVVVGRTDAWKLMRAAVSPMGRYVAVHDTAQSGDVPGRNQLRLYDLAQDTSYLFDGRSWARCDFDDEEQQMVFLSSGSIGSALCGNRLSIATLGEGAPVIRHTQEYGWPAISGDGSFVMSSGYGVAMDLSPYPVAKPRARVVEIESGKIVWSLDGDFSGGDNGSGYNELARPAWSRDASRLFCVRNSKNIPADWRGRIFYNTISSNDTVPFQRMVDSSEYNGSGWTETAGSTSNSQLTIGFKSGGGDFDGLRAESLVPTTSSVAGSTITADGGVVYPNPMTGTVTVSCGSNSIATKWTIYAFSGEEVASGALAPTPTREGAAYTFNLPRTVRAGAYMLQLQNGAIPLCTRKVVVK
ncbi:MAG: T9SS type A sorting domain-containing protein [Ignavibacteria bacterium]|nr:T9SS type A sorting domain-containing protein [Ignavibacteria bacterium]MBK9182062.1 T9SS type A sorting domain-containing protein [Ignavibacteria bacterium]